MLRVTSLFRVYLELIENELEKLNSNLHDVCHSAVRKSNKHRCLKGPSLNDAQQHRAAPCVMLENAIFTRNFALNDKYKPLFYQVLMLIACRCASYQHHLWCLPEAGSSGDALEMHPLPWLWPLQSLLHGWQTRRQSCLLQVWFPVIKRVS